MLCAGYKICELMRWSRVGMDFFGGRTAAVLWALAGIKVDGLCQ